VIRAREERIMTRVILEYFRCPDQFAVCEANPYLSAKSGHFQFGNDIFCYGRCSGGSPSAEFTSSSPDVSGAVEVNGERVQLPFDLSEIVDNLRLERYTKAQSGRETWAEAKLANKVYYLLRPILPAPVRKYLQKVRLSGWDQISFPHWPVDFTVESLMERTMALLLKTRRAQAIPFIWFWPNGSRGCAIITHDVEAEEGLHFCERLMDLDDAFGIKGSFQIIPEARYDAHNGFLDKFRRRGFEVNVHDLNHDGKLFQDQQEFRRRARQINAYAKAFGARGFRSGAMYRNQEWYDEFDFSYDMSVPNVAHLEPQRGGCCTVMPYFVGKILELPLTATQDYSLFHILQEYSTELWKQEIEMILEKNGLISFITHPDYLIEKRAQEVYRDLLSHLAKLRTEKKLWVALPAEVDRWWRNRSQMRLVQEGNAWRIDGLDCDRARIAYANLKDDGVVYSLDKPC
jgi:hypothetical protein